MEPRAFLFSLERLGMKFGLDNTLALCERLQHPEQAFRTVIVGGTNGKGSVTAMTATALTAAGHRTARYTSPHLERLEERFVVNDREVEPAALDAAAATVRDAALALVAEGRLAELPTFFECATVMAFELFRRAAVGIAVLEVGLGGRLDATNVVSPVAAAITSIDLDHQALLGDTLAAIAAEKAGIVKPGIPVVRGPMPAAAAEVIARVCAERGATLVDAAAVARWQVEVSDDAGTVVDLDTPRRHLHRLRLGLEGRHQAANAAVAALLLEALEDQGLVVGDDGVRAGLTGVQWPGRLERRQWRGAEVRLDAAHNPGGAHVLAAHLRDTGWTGCTLLIGVVRDKDVRGIVGALAPLAGAVVCTTPDTPRALPAAALAELVRGQIAADVTVASIDDPAEAAAAVCRPGARVVAAGSIFLVGPLRGILR